MEDGSLSYRAAWDASGRVSIDFYGPAVELESESDWSEVEYVDEPPPLRILVLLVGTQGDVQPLVQVCLELKRRGHTVRVATHEAFREFVQDNGLSFYPIAGDPKVLIAYMVRTGGALLPRSVSDMMVDVPEKRRFVTELLSSAHRAATDGFTADAIIANPVSFAHIHLAELLSVPLHMMFLMPNSPTTAFPHPLANLGYADGHSYANYLSYLVIDSLQWLGVGDLHNQWRQQELGLDPLRLGELGGLLLHAKRVPFTYLWSPLLIPKPRDWGPHIDVVGFSFLGDSGMPDWTPPDTLSAFLEQGPPLYIGFGSCVVDNPESCTALVYGAAHELDTPIILQRGWSGLGDDNPPDNVYVLDRAPHSWLFAHCRAAVHHGGSGTTAECLRRGIPCLIVPFFGDQPFWGHMVAQAGLGPEPVPFTSLTQDKLVQACRELLQPELRDTAEHISSSMTDGAAAAVDSFLGQLPVQHMVCDLDPTRIAKVYCRTCRLQLCLEADHVLHVSGVHRTEHQRRVHRAVHWDLAHSRPSRKLISAVMGPLREVSGAVSGFFSAPIHHVHYNGLQGLGTTVRKSVAKGIGRMAWAGVELTQSLGTAISDIVSDEAGESLDVHRVRHLGHGVKAAATVLLHGVLQGPAAFCARVQHGPESILPLFIVSMAIGATALVTKPLGAMFTGNALFLRGVLLTPTFLWNPVPTPAIQHVEVSPEYEDAVLQAFRQHKSSV